MLGADDDRVDTQGLTFLRVLYRHLALSVGAEVGHEVKLFLANASEFLKQRVGEVEGKRHQRGGLTASIAEHDTLIPCTLLFGSGALNPAVDVGTLTMDG